MKKEKNKKIIIIGSIICSVLLLGLITSYAFFRTPGMSNKNEEISLKTGSMELVFSDGDNGINEELDFGETVTKKFILENTGTLAASVKLSWLDLINTYTMGSLVYKLSYAKEENGDYTELVPESNIPVSREKLQQSLSSELSVAPGEVYYFNLDITLKNLKDVDQTSDFEAIFQTQFTVGEAERYIYYTLSVDPNGGTWNEFTSTQAYQMQKDETKEIPDPTRIGHSFNGWEITGEASTLDSRTFTMGIENSSLVAKWTPNKYQVTIDLGDGNSTNQEVEFGSTVELPENPSKEGYTFGGWDVTGGTLNGNTLTITDPDNVTVTAKWNINKYKYIVYHNKMNIDGNGYTLVDSDTDEGEADYNSQVTPGVKSYTGFSLPTVQDLTIKHETVYPPILNKVEYNYVRNKYTLTLDLQEGTYTGSTSEEMYYEASKVLGVPTKTGYDFTNWTVGSNVIEDNIFTMGTENVTAVANYTPKTFSVTFNANGGTVETESKTVTYNSTYGDLPTPTYEGYEFLGWFTESSGGTQVTSSTNVSLSDNQTLFAQWKKIITPGVEGTLAALKKSKKSGNPSFGSAATTDETKDGLYSMEDDYGTSYYYRGNVTDNYVKFGKWASDTPDQYIRYYTDSFGSSNYAAFDSLSECQANGSYTCSTLSRAGKDMYWRIIRVNGDGSLRMIYDGITYYYNVQTDVDRFAIIKKKFNTKQDDAKYVGYMYAPEGTDASTSKSQAQNNIVSSAVKTELEEWYNANFANNEYDDYISDSVFCNDREAPGQSVTKWSIDTGLGYGKNSTVYAAFSRFYNGDATAKTSPSPKFKCTQKNDAFTKSDLTKGNGAASQKVGLITADEVNAAGSGKIGTSNSYYFLNKGDTYWTSTPRNYGDDMVMMFVVYKTGELRVSYVNNDYGIAPVINLTPEAACTLAGEGSTTNPFTLGS